MKDVDRVSTDTKSDVNFAAPSVFLESLKILSDAQEKTIKPRKSLLMQDHPILRLRRKLKAQKTQQRATPLLRTYVVHVVRAHVVRVHVVRAHVVRVHVVRAHVVREVSITSLTSHTNFVARTRRTRTHSHQLISHLQNNH